MACRWLMKGLAALGLVMASAAADARAPAAPRPALWKVADRDTTIYLFGTIHLLPRGFPWRSPAFRAAAADAESLVVETIVADDPAPLRNVMTRLASSPGLPPVAERVPRASRAALATAIARSGAQPAALDRLETWAVALLLSAPQFQSMGLSQEAGVEAVLRRDFAAAGKPVGALESNEEQLGFFDLLPEPAQRSLLEGAIEQPEAARRQFATMLAAWTRGDTAAIARSFNEGMRDSPALLDLLVTRRNLKWSRWIELRLKQPGSVMVAVGAGHLAGQGSVQELLARRGLKVTRIQ